jgi:DNA modification methylase
MKKQLYFGDNLSVMRGQIADGSVDLIYLDPPFNSKRDYNLLFKAPKTLAKKPKISQPESTAAVADQVFSEAQITAFDDTWHWGDQSEDEFRQIGQQANTDVAELMRALRAFLRENDMMAYLTCMAIRLLELHRVLKPTGSLYLHCDPTASHYLKIVLDAVFGKDNYRSEVVWKRTSSHNSAKRWGPAHDVILFYSKSNKFIWNRVYESYDEKYIKDFYRHEDAGGKFRLSDLTGAGTRTGDSGLEWKGTNPTLVGRHWAVPKEVLEELKPKVKAGLLTTQEKLDKLEKLGLVYWPPKGKVPQFKRYFRVDRGTPLQDVIADIQPIGAQAAERLGYPTQKPLALLERIIEASSNEGDVILDPFCGCGTALDAAQKLKRQWIGIDITHLAIGLIERRLKERYPKLRPKGAFNITGRPEDLATARRLAEIDKYQFQFWALSLVGAQPFKGGKKGADGGVDGLIFPEVGKGKTEKIIVSVKGGDNVGVLAVRDLIATVAREKAAVGVLITLTPPTKGMVADAAAAGFYESPHHGACPKIQILTIEGLLEERERLKFVDMSYGGQTFKAAKPEARGKKSDTASLF